MKKIVMTFLTALAAGCADHTMPVAQLPEIDTNNPLLAEWNTPHETPPFDRIRVSDYEPAFDAAIAVSRAEIDAIVNNPAKPTFNNTIVALDRQGRLLSRVEGIFFNLLEADATPEMQQVAENVQPKLTALSNDISLNPQLFERVKAVYEHPGWFLSKEDKKLLEETYNGFVRSGANLSDEDKELYRQYSTELSELSLRFSRNVLAATNAFTINITDPAQVAELPDFVRDGMAAEAKARGEQGWTVTLQAPSYVPFMEYSTNRELKEKLWRASNSLCLGGEFDNTENIKRMVNLRLKIANLLGYPTYADYVLADRMAENAQTVNAFLDELLAQTKEYAVKDYNTIGEYARSQGFEGEVMPWDMAYYSEKYRHEKYELNEELVKPYLQLDSVKRGVFLLANKLYGLNFTPNPEVQGDVREAQKEMETTFNNAQEGIEEMAAKLLAKDKNAAVDFLTNYTNMTAQSTFDTWKQLGTFLIVKYNDGVVKRVKDGKFERNSIGQPAGVMRPGYPKEFLQEYVKQTGDRYKVPQE